MIEAPLLVYGFDENEVNWGYWTFEHMPCPGDVISLIDKGRSHDLKVRHVEHYPVSIERGIPGRPSSLIVTDWMKENPTESRAGL